MEDILNYISFHTEKKLSTLESNFLEILPSEIKQNQNIILNAQYIDDEHHFEIDFLFPEHKIAFELNGIKWHTDYKLKDKNKHKFKRDILKKYNYKLYNLYSDQFQDQYKIQLFLRHKFNLVDDINITNFNNFAIIKYPITKQALITNNSTNVVKNLLYLNMHTKYAYNTDYYILTYNNVHMAIIGIINNPNSEVIKIKRFNLYHTRKSNTYYRNALKLFIDHFLNNREFINKKFINFTIDNNLFTGESLKKLDFNIIYETTPIPKLADFSKNTRKGVQNLNVILKKSQKKLLIWDCGKTTYQYKIS